VRRSRAGAGAGEEGYGIRDEPDDICAPDLACMTTGEFAGRRVRGPRVGWGAASASSTIEGIRMRVVWAVLAIITIATAMVVFVGVAHRLDEQRRDPYRSRYALLPVLLLSGVVAMASVAALATGLVADRARDLAVLGVRGIGLGGAADEAAPQPEPAVTDDARAVEDAADGGDAADDGDAASGDAEPEGTATPQPKGDRRSVATGVTASDLSTDARRAQGEGRPVTPSAQGRQATDPAMAALVRPTRAPGTQPRTPDAAGPLTGSEVTGTALPSRPVSASPAPRPSSSPTPATRPPSATAPVPASHAAPPAPTARPSPPTSPGAKPPAAKPATPPPAAKAPAPKPAPAPAAHPPTAAPPAAAKAPAPKPAPSPAAQPSAAKPALPAQAAPPAHAAARPGNGPKDDKPGNGPKKP
jgi:hypothetical protein